MNSLKERQTQLTFADCGLNPSVEPWEEGALSDQQKKIYMLFYKRRRRVHFEDRLVSTDELRTIAGQYNTRISEIREWLGRWDPPWTISAPVKVDMYRRRYYGLMPVVEAERRGVMYEPRVRCG